MANNKNRDTEKRADKKKSKNTEGEGRISAEIQHSIWAIVCFVLGLFFILSAFGGAGAAGHFFYLLFTSLFGWGYILVPIVFILLGASFVRALRPNIALIHTISSIIFLLSGLGIIGATLPDKNAGGYIGSLVAYPFVKLFAPTMAIVVLGALFVISLVVLFNRQPALLPLFQKFFALFKWREKNADDEETSDEAYGPEDYEETETTDDGEQAEKIEDAPRDTTAEKPLIDDDEFESLSKLKSKSLKLKANYTPPPLELLEEDKGKPNTGDIKANSNIIKRTLANFGIEVEMDEITVGPTVTRYALKPAEGVKLSRIVGLQNDLALALAAHPIRIEAPIPGKSLVGIEIPNKSKSTVGLGTLLADERFRFGEKPLLVALGRNSSGKALFGNLAKMPHLLIAGATGSGKSVTIHSIITSLLYRNAPDAMRFIMVDPKRVELTLYNKIPHLLTPVITDAKKTILALKWAAKEMDRRYDILETEACRDIESYNSKRDGNSKKKSDGAQLEQMPYIVIVIDELADIMSSYPRELESAIVRLAQMSRAVGIHLILSTQRPEVNVITGLIKANVPARIALKVASQIDSRTILDAGGAEKLLGAGDMLYSSGEAQPERLQCAYISETEVKKVVKHLADNAMDDIVSEITLSGSNLSPDKSIFESTLDADEEADDDLYEEARQTVIETGKASTSFLQRKLGVGYARAARLIDMLEEHGVVGPGNGAKPRDVLEKPAAENTEGFM